MNDYIKQLEDQNEELRSLLAKSQSDNEPLQRELNRTKRNIASGFCGSAWGLDPKSKEFKTVRSIANDCGYEIKEDNGDIRFSDLPPEDDELLASLG